jgi:AbrB family looped-hinge helix DNA binding protein
MESWKFRKGAKMQTAAKTDFPQAWVKILSKGMVTIPKSFRDELGMKEGEIAKVKKVGLRLIIEPREVADYEIYSNQELKSMLKEDKLTTKMAKVASSLWPDLK